MPRLIAHIGLGKTATTVLQHKILPKAARAAGLDYSGTRSVAAHVRDRESGTLSPVPARFDRGSGRLVSSEALVGWDPHHWLRNLQTNRDFLGTDATVFLVIRQPRAYLRSTYQQLCHHMGHWLTPQEFFHTAESYIPHGTWPQCDLDAFDLTGLIAGYRQTFSRLVVQKYETLSDGRYLRALFGADDASVLQAAAVLAKHRSNRSYSQRAVAAGFAWAGWRERNLGTPRFDQGIPAHRRSLSDRLFRKAVQYGVDRLLPYQPYEPDWSTIPGLNLPRLDAAYAALPDFIDTRDVPPAPDLPA